MHRFDARYQSGCAWQAVDVYHQGVVFPLVNRDTSFLLILIICNKTLGFGDGPDIGSARRTPELSIRECVDDALCCMQQLISKCDTYVLNERSDMGVS